MLGWALTFLIIALVAAVFGFGGIAGTAVEIAKLALPPSTPEGFVFSPDGKSLYGTSYYTGASNVFRFDIASGKYKAARDPVGRRARALDPGLCPAGRRLLLRRAGHPQAGRP